MKSGSMASYRAAGAMGPCDPDDEPTHSTWVYICSEPGLWTVGFYDPHGAWIAESDHGRAEEAAQRVHYLNGGKT